MPKDRTEFVEENTQRAVQAANLSANWMAEIAEHNLNQGKAAVESMLTLTRKVFDGFGQQASAIRERSLDLTEQTFSNAFEFGQKMVRIKDPQELVQAQNEFVTRQAQLLAEQTQHLSQRLMHEVSEIATTTIPKAVETPRRRSEAA